jgi:gamma-glutamylcyclotransferase (GGCT)/AIG2-like uncharacterized protein YtfP
MRQVCVGDRIAFYGTLRWGEPAYRTLSLPGRLRFAGPCRLNGALFSLGPYPAFLDTEPGLVRADLFEILDTDVIRILDDYEEFDPADEAGSLYVRRLLSVDGSTEQAWTYVYASDVDPHTHIPCGDWLGYLQGSLRRTRRAAQSVAAQ